MATTLTFGSLFCGIGGIDLGLERAGMQCAWQVEINDFCNKVLEKHWPNVKRFRDVYECGSQNLQPVDLVAAGFPCQPFSTASRGRRTAVDLWPQARRIVSELKPRFVLCENVQRAPIEKAASDLEAMGYLPTLVEAGSAEAGAPTRRMRRWLVARSNCDSESIGPINVEVAKLRDVAASVPWPNQPRGLGVVDGLSNRMDRLHALGNAVVPQIVEWIGRSIVEASNERQASSR